MFGQRAVYNGNRPEVHDVIRRWRAIADSYDPPRVLLGETPVDDGDDARARSTAPSRRAALAFNFPFINAPFEAEPLRAIVEETEARLPPGAWPAWTGSNHDMSRLATRWAGDDPRKIRAALLMLLTLRGTPVLYQGDEIGLGDVRGRRTSRCATRSACGTGRTTRAATRCARRCTGATRPVAGSPRPA